MRAFQQSGNSTAPSLRWLFVAIGAIAIVSRIVASVTLPNAEQDGYSYAEIVERLTQHLETSQFHFSDLYGFWLPLFQVVTATLNLAIHDPLVAGKIVNVICGAAAAILVFDLTQRLTGSILFSLGAFAVIVTDPLHILYSAACMTDVPHGTLVLASLWFALRSKWTGAAVMGALAGCIRIESWALLLVLPTLQVIWTKRLPLLSILILLIPPLGWLGTTFLATGHPLTYFQERARYHVEYINFHPQRHGFQWPVISQDLDYFLTGAGRVITLAVFAVAGGVGWNWIRSRKLPNHLLLIPIGYYAGLLGLIVVAYVSKAQPVILPRYGLTFFALGLPLFIWVLQFVIARTTSKLLTMVLLLVVGAVLLAEDGKKLPTLGKVRNDFRAHQQIATAVRQKLNEVHGTCFSDDVAVRVLSRLPADLFLRTGLARQAGVTTGEAFLGYLRDHNARLLIFFPTEDSLPVMFFPELETKKSLSNSPFEFLEFKTSSFGPDIWLYQLR